MPVRRWSAAPDRIRWLPLAGAAVLVPLLIAAVGTVLHGAAIERALAGELGTALGAEGITPSRVEVSGMDATVFGVAGTDQVRLAAVARKVPGVHSVSTVDTAAPGALLLVVRPDSVLCAAQFPAEDRRRAMDVVYAAAGGRAVLDATAAGSGIPVSSPEVVGALIRAVLAENPEQVGLSWTGAGIVLTGSVPDAERHDRLWKAVRTAAPAPSIDDRMTVAPRRTQRLDVAALQASLNRMITTPGGIVFQPGSTAFGGHGTLLQERAVGLLRSVVDLEVELVAHAWPTEVAPEETGRLATARAEVLRDLLVSKGLSARAITLRGVVDPEPTPTRGPLAEIIIR